VNLNALNANDDADDSETSQLGDASFVSFVNSTHEIFDEGPEYEVVFHNNALTKLFNQMSPEELAMLIEKPVFVNTELEAPISLETAAKNRYSDAVLNQVYKVSLPKSDTKN
jgi:hypothetical protein